MGRPGERVGARGVTGSARIDRPGNHRRTKYGDPGRRQGKGGRDFGRTESQNLSPRPRRPWREEGQVGHLDHVYGVMPVLAALRARRRDPIYALYVQDGLDSGSGTNRVKKRGLDSIGVKTVLDLARGAGVPLQWVAKGELNELTGQRPHQGLVLAAGPLSFAPLDDLPAPDGGKQAVWLALDEVQDPQNLGAILRSARFLGVSGVLVSGKNCAPLSPAVSKASAGAMETMEVYATSHLPGILERAGSSGWRVIGTALDRRAINIGELDITREDSTIVVMGNEGAGLRTNVKSACTTLVEIEGGGEDPGLDSLNVSVAAAIVIHEVRRIQNGSER